MKKMWSYDLKMAQMLDWQTDFKQLLEIFKTLFLCLNKKIDRES